MSLSIRHAVISDAAVIAGFNCKLAYETENKELQLSIITAGVEAVLEDDTRGIYYVSCDGSRIVGQLMITLEWSDWRNGWFWWIQSVYVDKQYRQRGVYRSLYQHVVALASNDQSVCGIRLYVETENHRAQTTYKHLGMSITDYLIMEELV